MAGCCSIRSSSTRCSSEISIWGVPEGRLSLEVRESRFDDQHTLGALEELQRARRLGGDG